MERVASMSDGLPPRSKGRRWALLTGPNDVARRDLVLWVDRVQYRAAHEQLESVRPADRLYSLRSVAHEIASSVVTLVAPADSR